MLLKLRVCFSIILYDFVFYLIVEYNGSLSSWTSKDCPSLIRKPLKGIEETFEIFP